MFYILNGIKSVLTIAITIKVNKPSVSIVLIDAKSKAPCEIVKEIIL